MYQYLLSQVSLVLHLFVAGCHISSLALNWPLAFVQQNSGLLLALSQFFIATRHLGATNHNAETLL